MPFRRRKRKLRRGQYGIERRFGSGEIMSRADWLRAVECRALIDYDGFGYAMKRGLVDTTPITPSRRYMLPDDATHVIWFNR